MRSKMNSTLVGVFTITLVFLSAFVNMVGGSASPAPLQSRYVKPGGALYPISTGWEESPQEFSLQKFFFTRGSPLAQVWDQI